MHDVGNRRFYRAGHPNWFGRGRVPGCQRVLPASRVPRVGSVFMAEAARPQMPPKYCALTAAPCGEVGLLGSTASPPDGNSVALPARTNCWARIPEQAPIADHRGDVDRLRREAPSGTFQSHARPRHRGGAGCRARRSPTCRGPSWPKPRARRGRFLGLEGHRRSFSRRSPGSVVRLVRPRGRVLFRWLLEAPNRPLRDRRARRRSVCPPPPRSRGWGSAGCLARPGRRPPLPRSRAARRRRAPA